MVIHSYYTTIQLLYTMLTNIQGSRAAILGKCLSLWTNDRQLVRTLFRRFKGQGGKGLKRSNFQFSKQKYVSSTLFEIFCSIFDMIKIYLLFAYILPPFDRGEQLLGSCRFWFSYSFDFFAISDCAFWNENVTNNIIFIWVSLKRLS